MISIIISSYKPLYLEALRTNIEKTIGVPYEIIAIQNEGVMGICEAYNIGALRANYDQLCFIHEDLEFLTKNWGVSLIDLFKKDKELALAGLGGSRYKPSFVTGWTTGIEDYDRLHILQRTQEGEVIVHNQNPNNEIYAEVVTLDGVCLFTTKQHWGQNKFNKDLKGFHFYDLDFSLRFYGKNKKVAVLYFIDVIHFSMGGFNNSWLEAGFDFHENKEIQDIIKKIPAPKNEDNVLRNIKFFWIYRLKNEDISIYNKIKLYFNNYNLMNIKDVRFGLILFLKLTKLNLYRKFFN